MGLPLSFTPEERARNEIAAQTNTLSSRSQIAQGPSVYTNGRPLDSQPPPQISASYTGDGSGHVNQREAQPAAGYHNERPGDMAEDESNSDSSQTSTDEEENIFDIFGSPEDPDLVNTIIPDRRPFQVPENASISLFPAIDLQSHLAAASSAHERHGPILPPLLPNQQATPVTLPGYRALDYMLSYPEDLMASPWNATLPQFPHDERYSPPPPTVFTTFDVPDRRPQDINNPGARQSGSSRREPSTGNQGVERPERTVPGTDIADLAGPMTQHIKDIRSHCLPKYYELCESYGHILWRWCQRVHHDASLLSLRGPEVENLPTLRSVFWDIGRRWRSHNAYEIAIAVRDISNFLRLWNRYSWLHHQNLEDVPLLIDFAEILLQEGMESERMSWEPLVELHVGRNLNNIIRRMSMSWSGTADEEFALGENGIPNENEIQWE